MADGMKIGGTEWQMIAMETVKGKNLFNQCCHEHKLWQ